jgi:hypothetical protein
MTPSVLIIGCGALGRELAELRRLNNWSHVTLRCLPAELHNRPEQIAPALRKAIEAGRGEFEHIFVAYADCGTGGALDRLLAEYGIERLPGAHCYEFYAGGEPFHALAEAEPGTYFRNYHRLVYLSQAEDPALDEKARAHADYLGLEYHRHHCGFEPFNRAVSERIIQWRN